MPSPVSPSNAPAHFDAEVLSALGRLHRAGHLSAQQTEAQVGYAANAPIERHPLAPLLAGAWKLRHDLRLVDALYFELANTLNAPVVTTDAGLAAASQIAEHVSGDA